MWGNARTKKSISDEYSPIICPLLLSAECLWNDCLYVSLTDDLIASDLELWIAEMHNRPLSSKRLSMNFLGGMIWG